MALSELPSPPRPSASEVERPRAPTALRLFFGTYLPFVVTALWAALVVRMVAHDPRFLVPLLAVAAIWIVPMVVHRQRQRAMLLRGNVPEVLEAWAPALATTPFPETMQPLMIATAYAANGWTDQARETLRRAQKGDAWLAAEEQRLMIDLLLESFDGDRGAALRIAERLPQLALPPASLLLRRRVASLRAGLGALARAFARQPRPTDARLLAAAASSSPLLHWSFSYASAIVAIDRGDAEAAKRAIEGAPSWGAGSVFGPFHSEIVQQIERIEAIKAA